NSSISSKEREDLIKNVRKSRVDPFLENNGLINEEFIPIGLEKLPEVLIPEYREYLEREGRLIDQPPQKLDPGTKIINIFGQMDDERTLLILGEPGSGKTTILAELAQELIKRAETDNNLPIPVILNLSSWKKSQKIDEWIVKRLTEFYKIPEDKSRLLVSNQELFLLIDGFDELKSEYQNSCVKKLLDFIEDEKYEQIKIVICSRTGTEREELLEKLISRIAIRLQPLSEKKAYEYLKKELDHTDYQNLIKKKDELQELVTVPLFLYFIIDIYKSNNSQEIAFLLEGSDKDIRSRIFHEYIKKELKKWKSTRNHPKEKVIDWLIWLAKQMNQESLEDFLIEKLQPKWLSLPPNQVTKSLQDGSVEVGEAEGEKKDEPDSIQKIMYRIGVRLIVGLLCGVSCGLLSETLNYDPKTNPQPSLISYVIFGLISGLLSGLLLGLISLLLENLESRLKSALIKLPSRLKSWLPKIDDTLIPILRFVLIGFIFGLIRCGVSLLVEQDKIQPLDAIIFGGLSGFIFSYRLNCQEIETVERIDFSLQYFLSNSRPGMLIGFLSGISMLFIGTVAELIKNDNTPLINYSITNTFKSVINPLINPWIMNFLEKAVEPLTINEKPDILGNSILWGVLAFALLIGLNLWLIFGWEKVKLIVELRRERNSNKVNRTLRSISKSLSINLIISFVVSLLFVYFSHRNKDIILSISSFCQKLNVLWGVLTLEVFFGLQVGIGLGFRINNKIESAIKPNYGIITTRRNAIKIFLLSGLISGCVSIFFWWIYSNNQEIIWWIFYKKDDNGIIFGVIVGLMVGLLSGLVNGGNSGLVCIKHFVLRVILWRNDSTPLNYASFLDRAARGLLIKTGGSYRFKHRMLQEHLADMPLKKESEL
ncbi:MAG: hypothetical protein C6Y22_23580, partial [Hapalosiphonaceae cyanobacterium JJU2]